MSNSSKEKNKDKNDDDKDYTFEILILGDSDSGKTAILKRYVEDKFDKHHLTSIGVDYRIKNIKIDDKNIKLKILDTAGQERYRNITSQTYKNKDGIALIFDISDEYSFNIIIDWIEQIRDINEDEISLVLIGNKRSLENERVIEKEKGEEMAEKYGTKYFEVSALTGEGINEAFEYLAKLILKMKKQDSYKNRKISLFPNAYVKNKKKCN